MASRRDTSKFPNTSGWLPSDEEDSLRKIHEASDSERDFVDRNTDIAATVDFIRQGIGVDVARNLETNMPEANNSEKLVNIMKRERVQTELYKAVVGLDIYATNPFSAHLRDPKNFLHSRANRKLAGTTPLHRRMIERLRGAEAEVNDRFGAPDLPIVDRKNFVIGRVRADVETLLAINVGAADEAARLIGCPARGTFPDDNTYLDAIAVHLFDAQLNQLEAIRTATLPGAPNNLTSSQAFLDLILFTDIDRRMTRSIGAASVFDPRRVAAEYSIMRTNPLTRPVVSIVERILLPNALQDPEKSPDVRAFIATLYDQLRSITPSPAHLAAVAGMLVLAPTDPLVVSVARVRTVQDMIQSILDNELTVPAPAGAAAGTPPSLIRLNSFELMERILRRDYCARNGMDPLFFNPHVNAYAQLSARLRSKEAENIDLERLANKATADNLRKGWFTKTYNKIISSIGKAERVVGLEPVEVGRQTAQQMIDQIIMSDSEFAVFKGINKYSTQRDIMLMIYEKHGQVNPMVIARFTKILKEAIKGFKAGRKGKEFKTLTDDWDLVGLIGVLQKLEVEAQVRNSVEKSKLHAQGVTNEQKYLNFLVGKRAVENTVAQKLQDDLESPDAYWKILFSKNAIKNALVSEEVNTRRKALIDGQTKPLKARVALLNTEIATLGAAPGSPLLQSKIDEVSDLKFRIDALEAGHARSISLKQKIEEAKKFVEENHLSRSEAKLHYQEVGLAQVMDKLGTNLALENMWKKTKSGAKSLWSGTKTVGSWISARLKGTTDTTKKIASYPGGLIVRPTYAVGSAVTGLASWLISDVVGGALSIPGNIWRGINKNALKAYLLSEPRYLAREIAKINKKIGSVKDSIAIAQTRNYGENYQRMLIARLVNYQSDVAKLEAKYASLKAKADTAKLTIAPLSA